MALLTEREYRALEVDSYSSIKDFIEDRKKYHKKWWLKEEVEEETSKFLNNGSMVDCLMYKPEEFDERFALSTVQAPTATMLDFVNALFKRTLECLNEETGEITRDFEVISKEAYNDVKFDRNGNIVAFKVQSYEKTMEKFISSDAELYYRALRSNYGKTVVELSHVQTAEKTVAELKRNWVTREVMTRRENKRYDVYYQFPIIFEYKGYKLKALLDQLTVDHEEKLILPEDLKTCWDNEKEFQSNWFKYKYYIQAAVYWLAAKYWAEQEGWGNYTVKPMNFIVADSSNYQNPLIYETDEENLKQGLEGFTLRGKYYPGVNRAIEDLTWHKESNIWGISRENFESKGRVKIKPFIEDEY